MKYLLVLLVVLFGIWLWKHNRQAAQRPSDLPTPPQPKRTPVVPADMVACRHCGLHLPQHEAVAGQHGLYCSAAHRSAQEG